MVHVYDIDQCRVWNVPATTTHIMMDPTIAHGRAIGYTLGDQWINERTSTVFVCVRDDPPAGAKWIIVAGPPPQPKKPPPERITRPTR
jgi:hypothetical protein